MNLDILNEDMPALSFKPTKVADVYYDHKKKVYLRKDNSGNWIEIGDASLKRHLKRAYGLSSDDAETRIDNIQSSNAICYFGSISGLKEGIHQRPEGKVLITHEAQLVQPAVGDWKTIRTVIEGLLGGNPQQIIHFYGWLKIALEALHAECPRPGQALIFIGPADCGKSFLQWLITMVLGGRSADPYQFMVGSTAFNKELFEAEHLAMEDTSPKTDMPSRKAFGAALKQLTVNQTQRLHAKGRDAIAGLQPLWRVSLSLNDEDETLMMLPPFEQSLLDKLMLFQARHFDMPFGDGTMEGRKQLINAMGSEIPSFAHFLLNEFQIPAALNSRRFGITHFQDGALLGRLWGQDPEVRLLQLVEVFIIGKDSASYTGTSAALEKLLLETHAIRFEVSKLLSFNNACGTFLGRLALKFPGRVKQLPGRTDGKRYWRIEAETQHNSAPALPTVVPIGSATAPKLTAKSVVTEVLEAAIKLNETIYDVVGTLVMPLLQVFPDEELWPAWEEVAQAYVFLERHGILLKREDYVEPISADDALSATLKLRAKPLSDDDLIYLAQDFWPNIQELEKANDIPF